MIVILDNIRSALNVGSILRTCDAFGVGEVYACGITPGIENQKVVKTSLGAEKNINLKAFRSTKEAILALRKSHHNIYALEITRKAKDLRELKSDKSDEIALVIGNEVSGISNDVLVLCDQVFQIPMQGIKESLNVAVAFGIALYVLKNN